jgi:hypothetical protein
MVNTYRQYIDYNLLDSTILLIGIIKAHKKNRGEAINLHKKLMDFRYFLHFCQKA